MIAAVALAAAASVVAPSALSSQTALSPAEMLATAERLLAQGRVDDASQIVEALALNDAGGTQRRFLQGLVAVERRQYDRAATIFRTILRDEPAAVRVRLELARALFLKRDWSASDYHFRLADAAALPATAHQNIRAFRNQIRANRIWTASVEAGIAPDTNINQGSGRDTAVIYGLPFVLGDDARKTTGIGVTATAAGDVRLFRRGQRAVVISGFASGTNYAGTAFDDLVVGGDIGRQSLAGQGRLTVSATGFRRWYGNRPLNSGIGLRAQYETAPTSSQSAFQAAVQRIGYARSPVQTGWAFSGAVLTSRALSPTSVASARLTLTRQTARDPGYAFVDSGITVSIAREFGYGLSVAADLAVNRTVYDAALPAYGPDRRRDWRGRVSVALTKRDWLFAGFAPTLRLSQSLLRSNVTLFEFDRRRVELTVTRPF